MQTFFESSSKYHAYCYKECTDSTSFSQAKEKAQKIKTLIKIFDQKKSNKEEVLPLVTNFQVPYPNLQQRNLSLCWSVLLLPYLTIINASIFINKIVKTGNLKGIVVFNEAVNAKIQMIRWKEKMYRHVSSLGWGGKKICNTSTTKSSFVVLSWH